MAGLHIVDALDLFLFRYTVMMVHVPRDTLPRYMWMPTSKQTEITKELFELCWTPNGVLATNLVSHAR